MQEYDRFSDPEYIAWARKVKERDKFTCQICCETNTYLHSHHCNSWDIFIEQRLDVGNGITLCAFCHEKFHSSYGVGRNTRFQFEEYKKLAIILRKVALEHGKR